MMIDQDKCVKHFSVKADLWEGLYLRPSFKDRLELFINRLKEVVSPPADLLDFGCGAGVMANYLGQLGYTVTGVDAAIGMIENAEKERARNKLTSVSFNLIGCPPPPLGNESYDAIICSSVIEYLDDDKELLRNMADALRPGGFLLISLPHKSSILGKAEDLVSKLGLRSRISGIADITYSKRRYNEKVFISILRQLSFIAFDRTYFEVPLAGKLGFQLSRIKYFGVMMLLRARKAS